MGRVFQNHVHVRNPETGDAEWFAPGDEAPDWADGMVDEAHFKAPKNPDVEDDGNEGPVKVSYKRLNKDDLIDLADDRGLDTEGTRDELIARLEENDAALA